MKTGILMAGVVLLLFGCASLDYAGVASYTVRPVVIDGQAVCCEVAVHNGKQYASLDASIIKTGDDYAVTLSERGVEAFDGQRIAATAAAKTASTAAKTAAAVLVAPVAIPAAAGAVGAILK